MTGDGRTQMRPGVDRPITRADLEAKFEQLRGSTAPGETTRNVGLVAGIVAVIVLGVVVYLFGRRRGKKSRTIVEVVRA
jgi:hypothetical protein